MFACKFNYVIDLGMIDFSISFELAFESGVDDSRPTRDGRLFQIRGAATGKARSPTVSVICNVTTSSVFIDLLFVINIAHDHKTKSVIMVPASYLLQRQCTS
jgi:hypothetical protein